jgi:signal transduction histidine kinase
MKKKIWKDMRSQYKRDWQNEEPGEHGPGFHRRRRFPFRKRRGFFFVGFLLIFGLIASLIVSGIGGLIWALQQWLINGALPIDQNPRWLVAAALGLLIPFSLIFLVAWTRRRITDPLISIVQAAEAVSAGDLSVRVPEGRGQFNQMARAFNRMIAEIERTDELRRDLAADVAHELNTPLHIIQGYLEGIQDGVYQSDEEVVGIMLEEANLLSRLVEDLRTLSLAEAGQLPLELRSIDLAELLDDLRITFSGQAAESGIDLTVSHEEAGELNGDADRLNQVLGNLLSNALRHSSKGDEIRVEASHSAEGSTILVSDSGEGIAPEDLPFVFDRFWRADKSRTHADGSAHGLGLAISRQLIRAHGGDISVESSLGEGTTFTIWLPA